MAEEALPVEEEDEEDDMLSLPRKQRDDAEMDITPMIDITFLLLIFFLVASKMQESADVSLPKAKHGGAVLEKDSIMFLVYDNGDGTVRVTSGHGNELSKDLKEQETQIAEYIQQGLRGAGPFAGAEKSEVLIKAEGGVKHGEVNRIYKAVADAGGDDIDVPTVLHVAVLEDA